MGVLELFLLAVGLSMDAFAASVCKGLALGKARLGDCGIVGAWFGGFQALMPLLGYLLGLQFYDRITAIDHWIAFGLLSVIGGNMIRESRSDAEEEESGALTVRAMLPLAVATSIDALAIGVTFAFLSVQILPAVALIGVTTCCLSGIGVAVGSVAGAQYEKRAEFFGGAILILLGLKILLEHTGIL